jgi:hypothetical protein
VLDVDSIIAGEWDENAKRKDFTPAEAVAIKRDVEKELRAPAGRAREKRSRGARPQGERRGRRRVADKARPSSPAWIAAPREGRKGRRRGGARAGKIRRSRRRNEPHRQGQRGTKS